MDDFEKELKAGFLEEASQLMVDTEQCFLSLESSSGDPGILDKIFRLAHNLKGSAKAVGFNDLGAFTHELESYLLKVKNGEIQIQSESVTLLLECNDQVLKIIAALKNDYEAQVDSTALLMRIRAQMESSNSQAKIDQVPQLVATETKIMDADAGQLQPPSEAFESHFAEDIQEENQILSPDVNVPLNDCPTQTKSVISIESPLAPKSAPSTPQNIDESIRVSLARLEKLTNFVGEMVILQTVLREQTQVDSTDLIRKTVHQLGKVTKEVQDISMGLRMIPLKQTFQKMQRIVRDTAGGLGKKVQLNLQGEETELDKTVLENLGDPLVHLIRNAVDHGIESSEARIAQGKNEQGTILLNAYHQSGSLMIEIRDDGAGLDPEKLKSKAIEKGILKPGAQISDKDAYNLIFSSGFSTKAVVTDVSGRGVGMDVVKTNIEKLQGDIQIETKLGTGTSFKIRLPLTLAIIDAMVVTSDLERYVIPLSHVHESVRPRLTDIKHVTGMGDLLCLRGESLPLYRLSTLLGKRSGSKEACNFIAIVVRTGEKPFAILVDDILGQYQVVIKKLGEEHKTLKGFSGSAILGDGRPALILELPELMAKCKLPPALHVAPQNPNVQKLEEKRAIA